MTIEIKQLVIRAVVDSSRTPAVGPGSSTPFIPPGPPTPIQAQVHPAALDDQREAIVAACVREVLRKLERSRER